MARSVNTVILMGNLTRDPELKQTPTGMSVCSFSLALNSAYKDQNGEWQERTNYVDCVAWAGLGERVAQYMSKGRRCLVQGDLQSRSWEQDGQKRSKVEVRAAEVTFLDGRGEDGGNTGAGSNNGGSAAKPAAGKKDDTAIQDIGNEPINLDDIPF